MFWHVLVPLLAPGILAASLLVLVRTIALFELTFLTAGPDSQTLVVALYYAVFAAGVRAPQSVDAMAMIYMAVTLVWLLIALRFVNPTQLVSRVKEHRSRHVTSMARRSRIAKLSAASLDRVASDRSRGRRTRSTRCGIGIVHLGHRRVPSRAPGDLHRRRARAAAAATGASAASACARPTCATGWRRRTACTRRSRRARRACGVRVVGSVREVLFRRRRRATQVARARRRRDTRIVSLTVTEKGYCHDPATGRSTSAHPDIVHDLANPDAPRSVPGLLVAALDARRARARRAAHRRCAATTCRRTARCVAGLVRRLRDAARPVARATGSATSVAFPSTMVDRIVPATTDATSRETTRRSALHDAAPVVHEPFAQWVIEDRFAAGRPAWDAGRRRSSCADVDAVRDR